MSEPLLQQLTSAATAIARLVPVDADQQAVVGFLVGAVYSLRRAIDLGFADRTGSKVVADYPQELQRIASRLASSSDLSDEQAWSSGFYFNSALNRIAALSECIGKYLHDRPDLTPNVRRQVNRFKHALDCVVREGRTVGLAEAVAAICSLTDIYASVLTAGRARKDDTTCDVQSLRSC
jgi:hypothetical protein